jgi:hypothetical protein
MPFKNRRKCKSDFSKLFSQRESQFGKNFLQRKVLYEYVNKLLRNDLKLIQDSKKTNEF